MLQSNMVLLLDESIRVAQGFYSQTTKPEYFKYNSHQFPDLKKGDIVTVPTDSRVGFTCVEIIDPDYTFDLEANIELRWIVTKAPVEEYKSLVAREKAAIRVVTEAETRRKRQAMAESLLGAQSDTANRATALLFGAAGEPPAPSVAESDSPYDEDDEDLPK